MPQVLGFLLPGPHGGAGAVYVMLKRTMMEGRDE
jgi:DNA-nicking Smr family endonuclease